MLRYCILLTALLFCMSTALCADSGPHLKAKRYIEAYPDFFTGFANGCLVTKSGRQILFDDGIRAKDYSGMVTDARIGDRAFDPEDAFCWEYKALSPPPGVESPPEGDPGRIRPYEIFTYMYGKSRSVHMKRMRAVKWIARTDRKDNTILVTTVNGVDKALEQVARELMELPDEKKKALDGIVFNVRASSGYNERTVRGYPLRTSAHAYGIAIDVNHDDSFFIGAHALEPYSYRNNMPQFFVDIFEKHGFIWGGRWHSYDIMHFEYRPELIMNKGD